MKKIVIQKKKLKPIKETNKIIVSENEDSQAVTQ